MMSGMSLLNFFNILMNYGASHTTDRFEDFRNRKTSRYNSRFWNPGCEAEDAFSQNWSGENDWLVPPVHLIASTTLLKRVSWSNTKKCVGDRGPYSQTRFVGSTPINGLLE